MKKIKLLLTALIAVSVMFFGCESTKVDSANASAPKVAETQTEEKSASVEPTAEELAKYGIERKTDNNGNVSYRYVKEEELEKGEQYMLLNINKEEEGELEDVLLLCLYKLTDKNDVQGYKVGNQFIKNYPSFAFSCTVGFSKNTVGNSNYKELGISLVEKMFDLYGKVITFDTFEKFIGEEYIVYTYSSISGFPTKDLNLDIEVEHNFFATFLTAKKALEDNEIEMMQKSNERTVRKYPVYSKENKLEEGKSYMCLNPDKGKDYVKESKGYYTVYLHEIVDENNPFAYNIEKKYITSYPIAIVYLYTVNAPDIPDEIVYDGDKTSLFGIKWKNMSIPFIDFGGNAYSTGVIDTDTHIYHKVEMFNLYE